MQNRVQTLYNPIKKIFLKRFGYPVNFSKASKIKYHKPHKIKVQLAPCQTPVNNQTINKLQINRLCFTLEPPNGI